MESTELIETRSFEDHLERVLQHFEQQVEMWRDYLWRVGRKLDNEMITDAWIRAFKSLGIPGADHAKVWHRRATGSSYPEAYPWVLAFECPFEEHRSRRGVRSNVWLDMQEKGWPTIDPESPCEQCRESVGFLEWWMLACSRCQVGEVSDRHWPDEPGSFAVEGGEVLGCTAPYLAVDVELMRMVGIAEAHWWLERKDQAIERFEERLAAAKADGTYEWLWEGRITVDREMSRARSIVENETAAKSKTKALPPGVTVVEEFTLDQAIKLLDDKGLATDISQRDAIALVWVKDVPPSKNLIERAVTARKLRNTSS